VAEAFNDIQIMELGYYRANWPSFFFRRNHPVGFKQFKYL
jgi:hypothetical protein